MKIVKMFFAVIFSKKNQILFEKITEKFMEKIQNNDYVPFDVSNPNSSIILEARCNEKEIVFNIEGLHFNDTNLSPLASNKSKLSSFHIVHDKKSIDNIIDELEMNLGNILYNPSEYFLVFLYKFIDVIRFPIMKLLQEKIKKFRHVKRVKDNGFVFYYKITGRLSGPLTNIIIFIKSCNDPSNIEIMKSSLYYYKNGSEDNYCIGLSFEANNIRYFFEFSVSELVCLVDIELNAESKRDKHILEKIHGIIKFSYLNFYMISKPKYALQKQFDNENITIIINDNPIFEIKMDSKKKNVIVVNIHYDPCENVQVKDLKETFQIRNCSDEFNKILVRYNNIRNFCVITMFYRLFEFNFLIGFLIERILNKADTSISIILTHLFLRKKIIDKKIYNEIRDKEGFKISKIDLPEKLLSCFNNSTKEEMRLIAYCLILEAEKYINENDINEDNLFGKIKYIADVITDENNKNISEANCSKMFYNVVNKSMKMFNMSTGKNQFYYKNLVNENNQFVINSEKKVNLEKDKDNNYKKSNVGNIDLLKIFEKILNMVYKYDIRQKYEDIVEKNICNLISLIIDSSTVHYYAPKETVELDKNNIISKYNLDSAKIEKAYFKLKEKLKEKKFENQKIHCN
ncbi:uncharacterized protein VNE69_11178 [Vairimorpha necatrix]|uniref:Uncharacterized protein n=1 Tax=Vairimorpha necatrix TaxID=6039 RepID=A0AAX4JGD1_9MICR